MDTYKVPYDAILIPGGGLQEDGLPPAWSRARLDRALELFAGEYLIALSYGTVYRPPPRDARGSPIVESVAGAAYLISHGAPPDRVLFEACSLDTIGNAFFSRVIHVDPLSLRRLLVVTSKFHRPRTELAFRWVYGLQPSPYQLTFESTPDVGIDFETLRARKSKEAAALADLEVMASRITSMEAFHEWLFRDHAAYGVARQELSVGRELGTY